jgi:septal ring factor EnvC (AmiA/AmiB activator)
MAGLDMQQDRERRQLTDQIDDLRRRLDQSEQERRDKDRQLTALLTDQRAKEDEPHRRIGVFERLFGKRG